MADKQRWPYQQAMDIALELKGLLLPSCTHIEIAGSLRRGKETIGDIEFLCIPKIDDNPIFFRDYLDEAVRELRQEGILVRRFGADGRMLGYGSDNKFMVHVATRIPVDIFSTEAKNYGMALLVRTGSKVFNIDVMQRFLDMGMKGHAYGGVTDKYGEDRDCPDEDTVFRFLGWQWIPPSKRETGQYKLYTLPR